MTQEQILEKAKEAGFDVAQWAINGGIEVVIYEEGPITEQLRRFAALVATHERERIKAANAPEIEKINAHIKALSEAVLNERDACVKVCEEYAKVKPFSDFSHGSSKGADMCAAAIRSRSNAS